MAVLVDDPLGATSLLAVASDAAEDLPAAIWVHAASPFTDEAGVPYPNQLMSGTGDVHGPWIVCFNSREALALISSDAFLRGLLLNDRVVREISVGRLVEYALMEEARVVVNPFLDSGHQFSLEELRKVDRGRRP